MRNKFAYPLITFYPDTLPVRLDQLFLWKHWGIEILKHFLLDSPILRYDTIQLLDFFKARRN